MKQKKSKIIRAEVIGSMLRPKFLLDAQNQFKEGNITPLEFISLEDKAIKQAVSIQEKTGVDVVTDGELRRPVFCHNFVQAVDGFKWGVKGNSVIWFDMKGNKIIDPVTVGMVKKLKKKHDISVDEFSFLRAITNKPTKVTIPSPTMMAYYFVPGISDKIYSPKQFLNEVTYILKKSVEQLEKIGVTYIQVDAPEFGMLLDPIQRDWFKSKGFNPDTLVSEGIEMINEVLRDFSGTKGLHICRGNDKNRFMARGGYEKIAKVVFKKAKVDRLLLEFDSDRAGDFSPLVHVPKDKVVVLGLISTKTPKLEKAEDIIRRIEEAAKFVPKERLAISTQCGFASVAKGNNLSFADQEKKLKLVSKIARKVWKGGVIKMSIEVRFSDDGGGFPYEPQFIIEPQQETTVFKGEHRLFKVFCDQSDEIGWIDLINFEESMSVEVMRYVVKGRFSLDSFKINAPWVGIRRGDVARIVCSDGRIAKVAHNAFSNLGY